MRIFVLIVFLMILLPLGSSAHFIVGVVNNATDGEDANGKTVVLWKTADGINANLTDTVGPTGNSGADNIYLIDCELLANPCSVGEEVNVMVIKDGDEYNSYQATGSVSGAGFDLMDNLTLNSLPEAINLTLDDSTQSPSGEIDLTAGGTRAVSCEGIVQEYDGEDTLVNATAELFHTSSFYGDSDDNNYHYTNSSCALNLGYGSSTEAAFACFFDVEYYANAGSWSCSVRFEDNQTSFNIETNTSQVNTLLALSVPSPLDFDSANASEVSGEREVNFSNMGNVEINLSLSGYGSNIGDDLAMNCSVGNDIPVYYIKHNLTESNPGSLTLGQFESLYSNLTSEVDVKEVNMISRHNDITNDIVNSSYWRIYVPAGVSGSCQGNVVFGAVQAEGN